MERQTFTWGRSGSKIRRTERWVEGLWLLGLLLAALLLFSINLATVPLQDWREGTIALVAREIAAAPIKSWQWLYPTLAGKPYLEEAPLLPALIAGAYKLGGFNEWTTRLPGAILSAFSVPLLYAIGRELFPSRQSAIFSGLIYLTFLPLACTGRFAIADGTALCLVLLMMWCVLRSRRDFRWALGAGTSLSLICFTKGILLGLLILAIALLFLGWDTPRLLRSGYWWLGLLLGTAPVAVWYSGGVLQHNLTFLTIGIDSPSLNRLLSPIEGQTSVPWYKLGTIVLFSAPWLLFWPYGLRLAWEHRNWGWAKLVLVWTSVSVFAIALTLVQLPWYSLPIYPALALVGGAQLTEVWNLPSSKSYPRIWSKGLMLLAIGAVGISIYFGIQGNSDRSLAIIFASLALTMAMAAVLAARRDLQFILILFWGTYISLLLFMSSAYWVWQLEAVYPVRDIGAILRLRTPENQLIYASFPSERPALKFYGDRKVIPASNSELKQRWEQDKQPYLLLDNNTFTQLNLEPGEKIASAIGWVLITKDTN